MIVSYHRVCKQCIYYETNGEGAAACWAPESNWRKSKGRPDLRICGYTNIKFGERCHTIQPERGGV